MKGKKGVGHVEAILSFIIFSGFLFFLIFLFNPFSSQVDVELIDSVFTNIQEKTKTQVTSVSLNLNKTLELPGETTCFTPGEIGNIVRDDMECIGSNVNVVVKKSDGVTNDVIIGSNINPSENRKDIEYSGDFYTIYCSEKINHASSSVSNCISIGNIGIDYVLGQIVKRNVWSNSSLKEFEDEYNANYVTLKDEIVVRGNDFEFTVWDLDTQTPLFEGNQPRRPRASRIDARTIGINVLNEDATILKRTITIRVW